MMKYSACLCGAKPGVFEEFIRYEDETVFRKYEGMVIARCKRCGILKTIPPEKNKRFNPRQSQSVFYEENSEKFIRLFQPIVEKIKAHRPGGTVLDVGCSSGLLLSLFRDSGYKTVGIEPNKNAYKAARKKLGANIFSGTLQTFLKQNKDTFDIVIYNHVFEHIENLEREMELIKTALKKNGVLAVGVPNTNNVIFKLRKKYWEYLVPDQHVWHFDTKYLRRYLEKRGFVFLDINFNDDDRSEYPFAKKIYFGLLSMLNKLFGTGEAVLLIMKNC